MPSLDAVARLASRGTLELLGVVTQPDRRADRGRITASAVKALALALGLPVHQPARLRGSELDALLALAPDLLVWAAYGNLIPARLLERASGRAVNVHASLLPRWRGAAPIQHAILAGDAETGVTLMEGTAALDAGPVLVAERTPIGADETAGELTARLAQLGASLLERELPRYIAGALHAVPQDERAVTLAPKLARDAGRLEWDRPADDLARAVRACTPDPGAFTMFRGTRIGVRRAHVEGGSPKAHGVVEIRAGVPYVAAGAGWLRLDEVAPAGKRAMSGADWANGARGLAGATLPTS